MFQGKGLQTTYWLEGKANVAMFSLPTSWPTWHLSLDSLPTTWLATCHTWTHTTTSDVTLITWYLINHSDQLISHKWFYFRYTCCGGNLGYNKTNCGATTLLITGAWIIITAVIIMIPAQMIIQIIKWSCLCAPFNQHGRLIYI